MSFNSLLVGPQDYQLDQWVLGVCLLHWLESFCVRRMIGAISLSSPSFRVL